MPEVQETDTESPILRIPACDICRARKIRCDRKHPCSSCRGSQIPCRTTKRKGEKRQRIHVSGTFERDIQSVNARLASLEKTLQTFGQQNNPNVVEQATQARQASLSAVRDSQLTEKELNFEGESSFVAHSKHVTQAFESSLDSPLYSEATRDVSAAVASLRNVLNDRSATFGSTSMPSKALEEVIHYPELAQLNLPPMQVIIRMLRHIKTDPERFIYDVPSIDVAYLTDLCQKLYFPTEQYTIATFITVHVSLFYLFRGHKSRDPSSAHLFTNAEITEVVAVCTKNAELAIRNLRLCMESNYENTEALLLASMFGMELSRPSFVWTLTTKAARMAQDVGYHRLPSYSIAPQETKKRLLFWYIYSMDRLMSLNLGRSPTLQDCDITVDRPKCPEELRGAWGFMLICWIDYSELQGHIYDQLYCARAQKQPIEVKAERARGLASRLLEMKKSFVFESECAPFAASLNDAVLSTHIVMDSTLTLVYRMIPPAPLSSGEPHHPLKFCDEALRTARDALVAHNQAWRTMQHRGDDDWILFVHWTLLWCPFIPYIVVFGNVIADRDLQDLMLLEEVVNTLKDAATRSSSVGRLHHACRIFCQIARIYLKGSAGDPPRAPRITSPCPVPAQESTIPASTVGMDTADLFMVDFPLSTEEWDGMLDECDLGLGAENAKEMSSFFEQYLTANGSSLFGGKSA